VPSFRSVLQVREFRAVWLSDIQSLLGDQLARVALSVLVFDRTHSALVTAAVYSLTYLPAVLGTPLGALTDRLPRRELLVVGDLVRALLIAVIALPGLPLGVVMAVLFGAVLVGTPWKAAESALVADILAGEGYVLGSSIRLATSQAAQLAGFAVGGVVVAVLGPHLSLALDAATFAVSALVLRVSLTARPPARGPGAGRGLGWRGGVLVVLRSPRLRTLLGYSWLAGAIIVPEGLAAPYAAEVGGGAQAVGLLLASAPAGTLIGALLFVRVLRPDVRSRLVPVLAVASGLPLVACAGQPGLIATMALWAATGALMSYQVQVMTEFVRAAPAQFRGQAIAVASSGLLAVQGVGLLAGGLLTRVAGPATVIAGAGAVAAALAVLIALASLLAARRTPAMLGEADRIRLSAEPQGPPSPK
jgi:hypothetical protein